MKAAHWLGLGTDCVRVVKTNERGVMITEALNEAIEEEIEAKNIPLLVNATAGTTVLGAIDDLQSVAATCKKFGVWLHVDVSFVIFSLSSIPYHYCEDVICLLIMGDIIFILYFMFLIMGDTIFIISFMLFNYGRYYLYPFLCLLITGDMIFILCFMVPSNRTNKLCAWWESILL